MGMRTVKQISELTGISVRTLHYYDEIGLLRPTDKSDAGYRLYDDKALETLRQILYFREFDIPLKKIRTILNCSSLDRNQILKMQRKLLIAKKERTERLIAGIDNILKGEEKMDFAIFSKQEIEDIYHAMVSNMKEEQKEIFIRRYGSMEEWKKHFMETASGEEAQKNFQKLAEWYGGKEIAIEASKNPGDPERIPECQKKLDEIIKSIVGKKDCDAYSEEIQALMKEYDKIARQIYLMEDVTGLMLDVAKLYRTKPEVQKLTDSVWGEGAAEWLGEAMEAFYGAQEP